MNWKKELMEVAKMMRTTTGNEPVETDDLRYLLRLNVSPDIYIGYGYVLNRSTNCLDLGFVCGRTDSPQIGRKMRSFGDDRTKLRLFAERAVQIPSILDDNLDKPLTEK